VKLLGAVAATVLVLNGLLLAGFLGLEIESQIHTLQTRDDKSVAPLKDTAEKWSSDPPEVAPPPDHPPLEIIAGEFIFTVHYTTREWLLANDCGALTMLDKHQIWLPVGWGYPRDTLMHELLHVAKYAGLRAHFDEGYKGRNPFEYQDHDFIVPAAPEVLQLLRRNPKLTAWLTDPEHKEGWE
jgi:hypothetical protein